MDHTTVALVDRWLGGLAQVGSVCPSGLELVEAVDSLDVHLVTGSLGFF